jgi:hypothetical protein
MDDGAQRRRPLPSLSISLRPPCPPRPNPPLRFIQVYRSTPPSSASVSCCEEDDAGRSAAEENDAAELALDAHPRPPRRATARPDVDRRSPAAGESPDRPCRFLLAAACVQRRGRKTRSSRACVTTYPRRPMHWAPPRAPLSFSFSFFFSLSTWTPTWAGPTSTPAWPRKPSRPFIFRLKIRSRC